MLDFATSVGILAGALLRTLVAKHISFTCQEGRNSTGRVAPITGARALGLVRIGPYEMVGDRGVSPSIFTAM